MRISKLIELKQNKIRLEKIRKNRRNTVPFVGAGISVACGLYTWRGLLDALASEFLTSKERKDFEESSDYLSYAETIVKAPKNEGAVMRRIGELFEERDICIGKAPYFLMSSFANNVVTTNYDLILEKAAGKLQNKDEFKVLLPCLIGQVTAAIQENKRCLLKLHGSVEETSSMIFSKSQYDEFYGEGKPLPMFLDTFFSGKSILFVGCSLKQDRTIDILLNCINRNRSIRHYAIVELPKDSDIEIKQRDYLSSIGIDPIYYPEGDYESVELLLEYLAEDNTFIKEAKQVFTEFFDININSSTTDDIYKILVSIMNESYYNTAKNYPELFDLNGQSLDMVNAYKAAINSLGKVNDSLYNACICMFEILSRSGIRPAEDILESLTNNFADAALRETDIRVILQKQHMIYNSEKLNIEGKSNDELTKLADILNRKIQFENEMGFRNFIDYYNQAVELLDTACDRIEMHQRVLLCNTIGAWGMYVLDLEKPKKYLNYAILTIESLDENEQPYSLLSKCYCNLALLNYRDEDYKMAMYYAEKDLQYKCKINDNMRDYAGSLGHYALYQKECDPFSAIDTYIAVIRLKQENIQNADALRFERDKDVSIKEMKRKLTASWATSIFDLGLLSKDLLFYQLAEDFIKVANAYRYKIIDHVSKDYNSSCNVDMELSALLRKNQDIQKYISAVEGRLNMNDKLSVTIYHSWYICALYFYQCEKYVEAKKYIRKFYQDYYFKGDISDTRQEIRTKLLEAKILLKSDLDIKSAQIILDEAIKILKRKYSKDSFWLIEPYTIYNNIDNRFNSELIKLQEKYVKKRENAQVLLKKFINEVISMKSVIG